MVAEVTAGANAEKGEHQPGAENQPRPPYISVFLAFGDQADDGNGEDQPPLAKYVAEIVPEPGRVILQRRPLGIRQIVADDAIVELMQGPTHQK